MGRTGEVVFLTEICVAIIGVGSIAKLAHLPNYAKAEHVRVVGFVDTDVERARAVAASYAAEYHVAAPTVADTLAGLLAQTQVDAVSICTANVSHAALAVEALEAGLHVLLEKPMTVSLEQAQRLRKVAAAAGRVCMVGMSHRFRQDVEVLRRFIEAGELGEIYYVKTRILRRRGTPAGWFSDAAHSGGGPLMDIGVHALDLAWWLAGTPPIRTVSGMLCKAIGHDALDFVQRWESSASHNADNAIYSTEDFASAFLRFDGGMGMQMEVSWSLNGPEDDALKLDVFGSRGGISLDPLQFYHTSHGVLAAQSLSVPMGDLYAREIEHFLSCIRTGETPVCDVAQGEAVVEMLEMIAHSSALGREVAAR
ncbi:MAG: Gfo/Idh/MocA family oxidoreductase [Firmicutes bacterium]|nr:Gfo/Idh/MocA family oxidoreductase [Bacillota bacterium]